MRTSSASRQRVVAAFHQFRFSGHFKDFNCYDLSR